MCSIMAYCGEGCDIDEFMLALGRTASRGPDDTRTLSFHNGVLGFNRLAIMGLTPSGMQPFVLGKSAVVCNGELYGFEKEREELKKKGYTFESVSEVVRHEFAALESSPAYPRSVAIHEASRK